MSDHETENGEEKNLPYQRGGTLVTVHRWPVKEVHRDSAGKRVYVRTEKPTENYQVEFLGIYGPHAILRFKQAGEYRFSLDTGTCVDGKDMRDWVIAKDELKTLKRVKAHGSRALSFSAVGKEKEIV